MDFILLAFLGFAAITVMSAVAVISVRNPVHSVLFLVLTFFSAAGTWILAGAEFLGVALLVVYVGAVMVLFLFVVMMLDIDVTTLRQGYVRYLPIGLIVAVIMLAEVLALIGIGSRVTPFGPDPAEAAGLGNTAWVAHTLFRDYLLPFEIAALILTVAVVAAVMLTLRARVGVKRQDPAAQAAVRAADRVRIIRMEAVRPQVPAAPQRQDGEGQA